MVQPDIEIEETYTIETYHETRNIYRYQIEHGSVEMSKEEKEQESKLFKELYSRHAQLMSTQIGSEMSVLPKRNELFMYSFCEIVSTRNFEYDSLYVVFSLDLPDGWSCDDYELLTGVTHRCAMDKVRTNVYVVFYLYDHFSKEIRQKTQNFKKFFLQEGVLFSLKHTCEL